MGQRLILFLDTPVLLRRLAQPSTAESGADVQTGLLNLYELVHLLIRQGKGKLAEEAYDRLSGVAQGLTRPRIFEASRLRARLHDRGLSYADAAGYVTARELGAVFVTTDRGFAGLPGVKIVPM